MADDLLNGRVAEDFELAAIGHGRECERRRDLVQLAGLLSEYPRTAVPGGPPVSVLSLPELP
jgi:hypothetical protein